MESGGELAVFILVQETMPIRAGHGEIDRDVGDGGMGESDRRLLVADDDDLELGAKSGRKSISSIFRRAALRSSTISRRGGS